MSGWKEDSNNPGWYLWEGSDPQQEKNWTQTVASEPPEGYEPDPPNPGWYFNGTHPSVPSAWWADETVAPSQATCPYWTDEEVAASHGFPLANVQTYWPAIYAALASRGMGSPHSCVGALGTIAQETGSFAPVREAHWLSEAQRWAWYNDTSKHAPYNSSRRRTTITTSASRMCWGCPCYRTRTFCSPTHRQPPRRLPSTGTTATST